MIPGIRYRNAMAMIDWLCETFGFEKQAVYTGPGDIVMHAQLTFGNGMIMVSSVDNGTEAASVMKQEDEIGGAETQTPYLVVADCDAMYAHAKAAGAKIVILFESKDYGDKAFSCSDPEGHIWHIGAYNPLESGSTVKPASIDERRRHKTLRFCLYRRTRRVGHRCYSNQRCTSPRSSRLPRR